MNNAEADTFVKIDEVRAVSHHRSGESFCAPCDTSTGPYVKFVINHRNAYGFGEC